MYAGSTRGVAPGGPKFDNHAMPLTLLRTLLALAAALPLLTGLPALGDETPPSVVRLTTSIDRGYAAPAEALLREAYESLGLQIEYLPWPLARSDLELSAGRVDGVAMRPGAYFDRSPRLYKVDVPLMKLDLYAFGMPPCPADLTPQALAHHRVSYRRGMVVAESLLPESARVPSNTLSDAFLDLSLGHADYALALTPTLLADLPVEARGPRLCRVATPMASAQLYHGVLASRTAWVAALKDVLQQMRSRGEFERAWSGYRRQLREGQMHFQARPGRSLELVPAASRATDGTKERPAQIRRP